MATEALFEGLVVDEFDRPVEVVQVGGDDFYVVDEDGFRRHIESEKVDRQVLARLVQSIEGHEEVITLGTMQMLGQEDIFTKAAIERSLKDAADRIDEMLEQGIPESARLGLGMMGFRIVIDRQGNVIELVQPTAQGDEL